MLRDRSLLCTCGIRVLMSSTGTDPSSLFFSPPNNSLFKNFCKSHCSLFSPLLDSFNNCHLPSPPTPRPSGHTQVISLRPLPLSSQQSREHQRAPVLNKNTQVLLQNHETAMNMSFLFFIYFHGTSLPSSFHLDHYPPSVFTHPKLFWEEGNPLPLQHSHSLQCLNALPQLFLHCLFMSFPFYVFYGNSFSKSCRLQQMHRNTPSLCACLWVCLGLLAHCLWSLRHTHRNRYYM